MPHWQAKAAAALDAYVTAMAAHYEQLNVIRDEMQALGSQLPANVNLGTYENDHGLTIGDVDVRRQRVETSVSWLAMGVLRSLITWGRISLDTPQD